MNQPAAPAGLSALQLILRPIVWLLRFLSHLFKSIWIFFPGTIFLVLALWCFWSLSQGKDIIYAFAENSKARPYFFLAVAFWIYVSWYSSRVISYMLIYKQTGKPAPFETSTDKEKPNTTFSNTDYFHLPVTWLNIFPRLIGFSCLLIIELAVLQLSLFQAPGISSSTAWLSFTAAILIYISSYKSIEKLFENKPEKKKTVFYILLAIFVVLVFMISFSQSRSLMYLFWVLLMMHVVYVVYIHLRRSDKQIAQDKAKYEHANLFKRSLYRVMEALHIPVEELGYFTWFNIIAILGLVVYLLAILKINVAWNIGPFPFVLLAFAVLGGFGNIITAASVRANVNFHLIIFLLAFVLPSAETHQVRTFASRTTSIGVFKKRQNINEYFRGWVSERGKEIDSAVTGYNMYFVLANGGASRSGYWTASVLGKLEDATANSKEKFSRHLFCLSGASGGSVGNATFFSLLNERLQSKDSTSSMVRSATAYLQNDFLTYTIARMLGPDYFKFISHTHMMNDRAGALEEVLERSAERCKERLKPAFEKNFSSLLALKDAKDPLPIICINVTRMQDGSPGVISNILIDRKNFNNRVDVLSLLPDSLDMHLSTAVIMGARFPYVSPAGRIDELIFRQGNVSKKKDSVRAHYFVDGGYFDNSGAGVVQEMIRTIKIQSDTSRDIVFRQRVAKLKFTVIHITNSPVGTVAIEPVASIKNDLAAPLLTMVGAYDKQTTVNDKRLETFLQDLTPGKALYYPIHLYTNGNEALPEKEEPYAMNWFISDTTLKRMDKRLNNQPKLQALIASLTLNAKLK